MKNIVFGAVAGAVVLAAGFLLVAPAAQSLGGQTQSSRAFFQDNVVIGGQAFSTSSQGAATYTAASFANSRLIEHNASAALTATLPTNASLTALGYLQNQGDTQTVFVHASTTAITFAGNTGVSLQVASTTKQVPANATGRVECIRLGASEARRIDCLLIAD